MATPTRAPKTAKREAFAKMIAELDPITISRGLNLLADEAEKHIGKIELDIIRAERFNQIAKVPEMLQWIEHYRTLIAIRDAWREADLEFSIPQVVAAIRARHAKPKPAPVRGDVVPPPAPNPCPVCQNSGAHAEWCSRRTPPGLIHTTEK